MILKIFLCLLALVNTSVSNEYSGLLSRLYKKANNENRPLILVLDKSLEDLDDRSSNSKDSYVDEDKNAPSKFLDFFSPKHQPLKLEHKHKLYDNPLEQLEDQPKYQKSDLQNLAYRLKKERREQRERKYKKERKYREDELDNNDGRQERYELSKPDRYQYKNLDRYQDRNLDRYQDRSQYKYQDRNQDRYQDKNQYKYQVKYQDRNQDRYKEKYQDRYQYKSQDIYQDRGQDKHQESQDKKFEKRGLKSSVIKHLLRTYNDINCEAKDECADECDENFEGKKKDNCEKKCEVKYDCDKEIDSCGDDECADSEEKTGSTKGERLVTVTEKCNRC